MIKTIFVTWAMFLAVCCAWSGESQQQPSIQWKTEDYTLIAREMPLRDALNAFGTAQGLSVVMSEGVSGMISGSFRKIPPLEFLDRVTTLHNLTWYYDGAALYIYTSGEILTLLLDLKYMTAAEVSTMLKELNVEDARFPLKATSDQAIVMVAGPPRYVQLVAELVDKADKLREQRAFSKIETRVFPLLHTWADDVTLPVSGGESTAQIKGVAKMLEEIMMSTFNSNAREKSDEDKNKKEGQQLLESSLDREFKPVIKAENRLNSVIIRDVSSRMPLYEKLIAELDVPQKLVEIAVTSLEMSKDDALDWQLSLAVRGGSSNMDGAAGQSVSALFSPENLAGNGLAGAMSYIGKHVSVAASVTALREKGKARSISRTSLLTMNNMAASLSDTQSYHARVVGTEVATLEEVSAGTSLQVKPRIVHSNEKDKPNQLWMTVSLTDGGFEALTVDAMPLTRSSTVTTQTAVYEGECILLAGYMRDIEENVSWGIPFMRDIPFIGWLFGGVGKKTETVQRMFILTPYIVNLDTADLAREQATRQRDITREETLEDDKKEDDDIREMRDLERKNRDEKRREKNSDLLEKRKEEIKLEKDMRQADREKQNTQWKEDIKQKREEWEKLQKDLDDLMKKHGADTPAEKTDNKAVSAEK